MYYYTEMTATNYVDRSIVYVDKTTFEIINVYILCSIKSPYHLCQFWHNVVKG